MINCYYYFYHQFNDYFPLHFTVGVGDTSYEKTVDSHEEYLDFLQSEECLHLDAHM